MSAFELLVDCVKDATKERDELAAALEQCHRELARTANAIDDIYRASDEGRKLVCAHYGSWHPQFVAELPDYKGSQTAGDSEPGSTKQRLDMLDQFEEAERIAEHVSNLTKTDGDALPPGPPDPPPGGPMRRWGDDTEQPKPPQTVPDQGKNDG